MYISYNIVCYENIFATTISLGKHPLQ